MDHRSNKLDYGQSHKHSVADSVLKRGGTPIFFVLLTDSKELISSINSQLSIIDQQHGSIRHNFHVPNSRTFSRLQQQQQQRKNSSKTDRDDSLGSILLTPIAATTMASALTNRIVSPQIDRFVIILHQR